MRHARLAASHPERRLAHYEGALVRQLTLLGRSLMSELQNDTPDELATEVLDLVNLTSSLSRSESEAMELAIYSLAEELWNGGEELRVPLSFTEHANPVSRRVFQRSARSNWKTA
jgi:hypothetical protein